MVLAIAAEMNYEVFQLDVQTAFLNADVEEYVCVKTAPGCENTNKTGEPQVTRCLKASTACPNHHSTGGKPSTHSCYMINSL